MNPDPKEHQTAEPIAVLDGSGESCATFTPVVATRLRGMRPGALLEVISDDGSAPQALASWARLSGNELLEARTDESGRRRFLIRRRRYQDSGADRAERKEGAP